MIPPSTSLVKYDNPVLISRTTDKRDPKNKVKKPNGLPSMTTSAALSSTSSDPVPSPSRTKLPPVSPKNGQSANSEIEEILNSIVPPREVSEGGQLFIQSISSTPATRLDVIALQELLDTRLHQRQARETGICPVRRELYSQAFDELIRHVAINCAERGLLLLRVRDEMRMTLAAYQTLYESSVAFGMRKAMLAEQGKGEMEDKIARLEREKGELEAEVARLKARAEEIERREQERRLTDQRKHEEELQFLKRTNQQLKTQLENILAPPKK